MESWASETRSKIAFESKIGDENVVQVDGGYRDLDTLEYWIVPKNANPPVASPTYIFSQTFECPSINIFEEGMNMDSNGLASFKASIYPKKDVSYHWSASSGEIVSADEDLVKIRTNGEKKITVFVDVSGLPLPCNRVQFKTFEVGIRPYLVDSAPRYNFSELSARFQSFMVQLADHPGYTGYVIAYAGRNYGAWERNMALASIQRIIAFGKYDPYVVKVVNGGYREYNSVDMWVLPPGVEPPKPSPSVDAGLVQVKRTR